MHRTSPKMISRHPSPRQPSVRQPSLHRRAKTREGAMLVLICVMILAFFVTVAFSVDIAYMHLVKAELRSGTDAAAKAAAEALARTQSTSDATSQGLAIALENRVAGQELRLRDTDFRFGNSSPDQTGKFVFEENKRPFNSVQVTGARDSASLSGSVNLYFAKLLGVSAFSPKETATATYVERDIVLVVDRSGSMRGQKFRDLQAAVRVFVDVLVRNPVEEKVGLASYSTFATEDVQMTDQLQLINDAMNRMPVDGFTSISRGIEAGERIMRNSRSRDFVERTFVVMTDGIHNTGIDPEIPARRVAAEGVTIHTITFGSDAERGRMQRIAEIGHGKHFHADNGRQLQAVFREIALTLSTIITE
jgi:uncharacterized protein YegL